GGADETGAVASDAERPPEADVRSDEERGADGEPDGDPARERLVRLADRLLEPGGEGDDPEQDPVVPVAERAQRELGAPLLRGRLECALDVLLVAEVDPPERRAEAEREQRDEDEAAVERQPRRSRAD